MIAEKTHEFRRLIKTVEGDRINGILIHGKQTKRPSTRQKDQLTVVASNNRVVTTLNSCGVIKTNKTRVKRNEKQTGLLKVRLTSNL